MRLINEKIIEDITDSLGLRFFPKDKRDEILTGMLEVISKKASIRIVKKFSDAEAEEFNKIPEYDLEKMEDFMIAKNPHAENIFNEEAEKLKEDLLNMKITG